MSRAIPKSSIWGPKNGQSVPDVATTVSSRWENKQTSLDLLAALLIIRPAFISPTHIYLLSIRIPKSFAAEDPDSQPLDYKDAQGSGLKAQLGFSLCEHLGIFVELFDQEVRSALSRVPALLLLSVPLNFKSAENVLRLYSVLFFKPIYSIV